MKEVAAAGQDFAQAPQPRRLNAGKLLHELEVHQAELEMQNEQLQKAQLELEISNERYADFYDFAPVGFLTLNDEGLIEEINLTGAALLGGERNKLLHRKLSKYVATEDRDDWLRFFSASLKQGEKQACELAIKRGDGSPFYAQLECLHSIKDKISLRIVLTDISERRADEAKIWRLSCFYNALAKCNETIARAGDEEALFAEICNILIQIGGIKMAWFGFLDEAGKQVVPFASCGEDREYLEDIRILMDPESSFGRGPTGTSIREDRPFWCQDFMHDPVTAPWHERGARFGWRSSAAVPLHRSSKVIGAFMLYSGYINAFDEDVQKLLVELAENISRALDNFDIDNERKRLALEMSNAQRLLNEAERLACLGGWEFDIDTGKQKWTAGIYNIHEVDIDYEPTVEKGINFYTSESRPIIERLVQRACEHGEPFDVELKIVTAKGSIRNVHAIGSADLKNRRIYGIFQDITERKKAEEKLLRNARDLRERVKEASCLRDITSLLVKNKWGLEFVIDSCVRCIPSGWLEPQLTCARIMFDGKAFVSPNFKETEYKLSARIPLASKKSGMVEVFYLSDETIENPFLAEEHDLINSIAIQIGQALERRWAEEKLRLQRNNFRRILDAIPDGIYIVSRNYDIEYVNSAIEREYGKLDGQKCFAYLHGRTEPCPWCKNEEVFRDNTVRWQWHSDQTDRDYDMLDAPIINQDGTVSKFKMSHDITPHKLAEAQIRNLSYYDTLTQLPNRRMLNERFDQAMAASKRSGLYSAAMFLDLNNFKPLNDRYGHKAGDILLVEVAKRLKNCIREIDTVARFGGDEFVILLGELDKDKSKAKVEVGIVAEKVRTLLAEPFLLKIPSEGNAAIEHSCTSSIGVALFNGHETSQDAIIKNADQAMYQAKQAGRNQISFYDAQA